MFAGPGFADPPQSAARQSPASFLFPHIPCARSNTYHANLPRRSRTRTREDAVRATETLRALLNSGRITVAPGAYDGLSARLVEQAGFPAVYASGGAIARSAGVPDLGLLPMPAIANRLASMADVTGVPIIADADTGYGNALNAQAAARAFERTGVAAFHIEDQIFPK